LAKSVAHTMLLQPRSCSRKQIFSERMSDGPCKTYAALRDKPATSRDLFVLRVEYPIKMIEIKSYLHVSVELNDCLHK